MNISEVQIEIKDLTNEWRDKWIAALVKSPDDPASEEYAKELLKYGYNAVVGKVSIDSLNLFVEAAGQDGQAQFLVDAANERMMDTWPYNMHHGVPIHVYDLKTPVWESIKILLHIDKSFSGDEREVMEEDMMVGYVTEEAMQEHIPEEEW